MVLDELLSIPYSSNFDFEIFEKCLIGRKQSFRLVSKQKHGKLNLHDAVRR